MAELHIQREESQGVVPGGSSGWHPLQRISKFFKRHSPFKGREKAELSGEKEEAAELLQESPEFIADVEVKENSKSYLFHVDVPGFKEKDVEVFLDGSYLIIKGHREIEKEKKTETYYLNERSFGSFTRSFLLPEQANQDAIRATLKDGVLTVEVDKK